MIRTPENGMKSGVFYHVQFRSPKSSSREYRDRWHFYSTDVVPIPLTEEQMECWQTYGSYGFLSEKTGKEYLKKIRKLSDDKVEDNIYRLAKITFLISTDEVKGD